MTVVYLEGMEDGLALAVGRLLFVARQPLVAGIAGLELEHCCTWSPGVDIGTTIAVGTIYEGESSQLTGDDDDAVARPPGPMGGAVRAVPARATPSTIRNRLLHHLLLPNTCWTALRTVSLTPGQGAA